MNGQAEASKLTVSPLGEQATLARAKTADDGNRYIKTEMTEKSIQDPEYSSYQLGRTPAKRWGLPEDFRGAVVFLASGASNFVTGTSIVIDGGLLGR
jgi:NAD(P)-dependent dehydrogenase (short-subunit alcohol dehydrogenase family)